MKISEIRPVRSDSVEINCQAIYDAVIACQREFDGNPVFEKNILETLNSIEDLLYQVNDAELFSEIFELIIRFRFYARQLKDQIRFIDDERICSSRNMTYILGEMEKFKEII